MQLPFLFLSSLLVAWVVLGTLHASVSTLRAFKDEVREFSFKLYVQEALNTVMDDVDSSSLPMPPRIHSRGSLTYTDGSSVSVSSRLRPHLDSNAISTIGINEKGSLWILEIKKESGDYKAKACLRFKNTFSFEDTRLFIAIGIDGFSIVRGATFRWKPGCREITFSPSKSMVVQKTTLNPLTFRVLLPVTREYTLYVDKELNLRYLSTAGDEILENQPLVEKIYPLTFSLSTPFDGSLYIVSSSVNSTQIPIEASHRLLRGNYLLHIFGRP